MSKEIGSEFWIDDIPTGCAVNSLHRLNIWGNYVLTSSGSGALSLMLKYVDGKTISKVVLLPSYICQSVIAPFMKEGYTCYFYDVDKKLKPDLKSIGMFRGKKIGIFVHMGYYGFPTNNNLGSIVKQFKNNNSIIVENVTHTLFSKYKRLEENGYYAASLRKWTGIPSGGLLAFRDQEIQNKLNIQHNFVDIRKRALLLKGEFIRSGNKGLKQKYLDMFKEAENILDEDINPYSIDSISLDILNRTDTEELVRKRRENFLFLSTNIKENQLIKPVFGGLPKCVCPMFFPIYTRDGRDEIRGELIKNDIYCPIHWPVPHCVDLNKFSGSKKIYERIISIPCDQRYGLKDMARITKIIKDINFGNINSNTD